MALLILVVALISGGIAMLSGFGIGSLLTPIFSALVDTKAAVAAVSLPHAIATASRLWLLRSHVHRRLVWTFGVMSAGGGLLGALLHTRASSPALARVFGALLVLAAVSQLTGLSDRWRFRGFSAWLAGATSGFFGGLVGNQGGIRSAAMLGLDLSKDQFVATGAAIALLVDLVRVPIYLASEWVAVAALAPQLLIATVGCIVGTFLGGGILLRLPPRRFRTLVAVTILLLGIGMLVESASGV